MRQLTCLFIFVFIFLTANNVVAFGSDTPTNELWDDGIRVVTADNNGLRLHNTRKKLYSTISYNKQVEYLVLYFKNIFSVIDDYSEDKMVFVKRGGEYFFLEKNLKIAFPRDLCLQLFCKNPPHCSRHQLYSTVTAALFHWQIENP